MQYTYDSVIVAVGSKFLKNFTKALNGKLYLIDFKRNCTRVSLVLPLFFFFVKFQVILHSKISQFSMGNLFKETFRVTGRKFKASE